MKKQIVSPRAPAALGPYSQAIQSGKHLYLSGQLGLDPATGEFAAPDAAGQTRQALLNLEAVLNAAGANIDDVVKTTVLLTDINDFVSVNTEYAKVFSKEPPARSCFAVAALPKGGKVEIEAIAILKD